MRYEAMFFDFDGTLVDSAAAKRRTFFELFPKTDRHVEIVDGVLAADPDGSRYDVIPRIVQEMRSAQIVAPRLDDVESLIQQYGESALCAVRQAPEIPGATRFLDYLLSENVDIYLCTNTPQDAIESLLAARRWRHYFVDVAGYPTRKTEFVRRHLRRKSVSPQRAAFVGDGASDEEAARLNGVDFFKIENNGDLGNVAMNMVASLDV